MFDVDKLKGGYNLKHLPGCYYIECCIKPHEYSYVQRQASCTNIIDSPHTGATSRASAFGTRSMQVCMMLTRNYPEMLVVVLTAGTQRRPAQ